MNLTQALEIMKPDPLTLDGLKKAYRKKAMLYHPDHNEHGLEMMKLINAANTFLQTSPSLWVSNSKQRIFEDEFFSSFYSNPGIDAAIEELLEKLKKFKDITIEIIK